MGNGLFGTKEGSLERAIKIAKEAHQDQVNKAGEPYILHPMRVMDNVHSDDEKIVAILHDVVEKSPDWTLSRLSDEGFSTQIIEAVNALTRSKDENYEDFLLRASANPIGRVVKLADLEDNLDMSEGLGTSHSEKYRRAIDLIEKQPPRPSNHN